MVVVGGGITGAGVALDAATRGYSVALLERADYRLGHLQPLEQARPRRPALPAELRPRARARGAARAPADGRAGAAPRAPAAARGARLRRRAPRPPGRRRAEPLRRDVASTRLRARRGRRGQGGALHSRGAGGRRGERVLEPRAPPRDLRRGGARAAARAGRARADQRLSLLRLPDRRRAPRADRARRGRALRRGLRQPPRRHRPARARRPRRRACEALDVRERRRASRCAPPTWSTRPACGPIELRPQELHEEAELPRIRPSRGTHITIRHEDLPLVGGAIVPAGAGRSIFALPWLGHTLVGTTDNDYEGPLDHIQPSADDVDYLLDAVNEFFGNEPRPGRSDRRLRGRAAADLHRATRRSRSTSRARPSCMRPPRG